MTLSIADKTKYSRKSEVLDVLPSENHHQRLMVIRESSQDGECLVLQQESFAPDVGWFTQSRVSITHDQLCGLKVLLTGRAASLATPAQITRKSYLLSQEDVSAEDSILSFPQAG